MFALFGFILSLSSFAIEWNDLELDQKLELTQSFQLKQSERSSSSVEVMKGEKFTLKEIVGLDMIKVTLFRLNYGNCPGAQMVTEMEIIPVDNTSPLVEVGAQLEKFCMLEIFIENKDLMSEGFFSF